jgi:cyclopropane fatty-acyl-phospholipid synthase-like methyltransferase
VDEATLQFYRGNAEAYARREITSRQARLAAFLAQLPPGASILELGCGAGGDTAGNAGARVRGARDGRIAGNG